MAAWLDDAEWKRVQQAVPIVCVDVLPLRKGRDGIESVGLIYRDTPHQGRRWMLVGGRLLRNESLAEAAARQLRETLGSGVRFQIDPQAQPLYLAQYFTVARELGQVDPRQHAVTANYAIAIEGGPVASGEAISFEWFPPDRLPPRGAFGFEQDQVVEACLSRLGLPPRASQGIFVE